MAFSDALAAVALAVSVFSAWVSYKAHRETTDFGERTARLSFERERSEFLVRIDRSRKYFERTLHRINELLIEFEGQPEKVRSMLKGEIERLESDREYLKGCLRQAWALWEETYEMSQAGLAHHKPRHLSLIEEDESYASDALARADKAEEALHLAHSIANPAIG